jgi:hypothetical protein
MIVLFKKHNNNTEKKSSRGDWADLQANIRGRALRSATPVRSTTIQPYLERRNVMSNSCTETTTIKKLGKLFSAGLLASLCFATPASAQYWHTVGTVNHALENNLYDGTQVINEVDLQTNLNTRIRIHSNGQIQINPAYGGGIGSNSGQGQFATMQVQGGDVSSFAGYTVQNSDWGQNIQSYVTRINTVSYVVNYNGHDRFYVAGGGWVYANGAYFGSDRNLKTDIRKIPDALSKVLKLNGVMFQWKEEEPCKDCPKETSAKSEHRTEMGLIAQDVEKVVPEVVRTVADGTKALAYQNLVALLIESTKIQQQQLDTQAETIKVLQNQVNKLQKR